ncbi:hypothetical protein Tco_0343033, partial [Tanacetum coccineum]
MKYDVLKSQTDFQSESDLNLLNFFDNTDDVTLDNPSDDERDTSSDDGNEIAPNIHNSPLPVNEGATFATLI